jgi:translation initiation factor RLI1
VFEDRNDFFCGQAGVEECRAAAFGEFLFALAATEQADVFVFAIPSTHVDIFTATNAVLRTLFILTKKLLQVVHDYAP